MSEEAYILEALQTHSQCTLDDILKQEPNNFNNIQAMLDNVKVDTTHNYKHNIMLNIYENETKLTTEDIYIENLLMNVQDQPIDNDALKLILQDIEPIVVEEAKVQQDMRYIVDYVDLLEKDPYKVGNNQKEFQSLLFLHYEQNKHALQSFQETKQNKQIFQLYQQIAGKQSESRLKCIRWYKNMIALGTSRATIIIISDNVIKLQSDSSVIVCPIVAMEFMDDGNSLLAITQQQMLLYHKNKLAKVFPQIHAGIPLSLIVYGDTNNGLIQSVTCDSTGIVQINRIKKSTFTYGITKTVIFKDTGVCHQLEHAKIGILETVALALKDQVLVVVLEPFIKVAFKKPFDSKPRQFIWIKWQQYGSLLAVGNGNYIEILSMSYQKNDGNISTNFQIHSSYTLGQNDKIESLHWLSQGLIFSKLDRRRYYILNLGKFNQQDAIISSGQLTSQVAEQIQSIRDESITSFNNTIDSRDNCLLYLEIQPMDNTNKVQFMVQYCLKNWLEYIQELIGNLEWNECLVLCLQLYQGKEDRLSGLPIEESLRIEHMRPILNDIIYKFVQQRVTCNQMESTIPTSIEFLVTIDSFTFLFKNLRALYAKHNQDKQFLNCLEPFILRNLIKYIPSEALKDVMTNLKQQHKLCTLKQLIINLDIEQLDSIYVQQLCIEFNLFTPLIYISPRVDDDYKTPLFKLYAVYSQLLRDYTSLQGKPQKDIINKIKNDSDSQIYRYFNDLEIDIPTTSDAMQKEIKLQGYRCIWYLHMCFIGELFPNQCIPEQSWGRIVSEIMIWLFQEDTMMVFLAMDAYVILNEIMILFTPPRFDAISIIQNQILSGLRFSMPPQVEYQYLSQLILDILYNCCKQLKLLNVFQLFTGEMMQQQQEVSYKHYLMALHYSLQNPYTNIKEYSLFNSFKFLNPDDQTKLIVVESHECKNLKEKCLIYYMRKFRVQLLSDNDAINSIIDTHSRLYIAFNKVMAELYYQLKDYEKCINTLINSQQADDNISVFEYIDLILSNAKQPKLILNYILTIIPLLVQIDAEQLTKVLQHYNEQDFKVAFQQLNTHPELKLKLLNQIVTEKRQNKELVDDKLMIQFFELICQFHKNQVYEQLQIGDFPTDPCLHLCQQYNVIIGVAYLTEKRGKYLEAINLYFDMISSELKIYVQKESNLLKHSQGLIELIQIQIHPCLQICRVNHSADEEDNVNNWFQLIIRMVRLRQDFTHMPLVFQCLNHVYQIMLEEVLERLELRSIIGNLKLLFNSFCIADEFKRTFTKLLSSCSFELHNQQQLQEVVHSDINKIHYELYNIKTKGSLFGYECCTCQEQRDQQRIAFVRCEHIYHVGCVARLQSFVVCDICMNIPSYRISIELMLAQENFIKQQHKHRSENHYLSLNQGFQQNQVKQSMKQGNIEVALSKTELKEMKINRLKMLDIDKEQLQQQVDEFSELY